jgi:ATPase family AAA domain-containing protein 1
MRRTCSGITTTRHDTVRKSQRFIRGKRRRWAGQHRQPFYSCHLSYESFCFVGWIVLMCTCTVISSTTGSVPSSSSSSASEGCATTLLLGSSIKNNDADHSDTLTTKKKKNIWFWSRPIALQKLPLHHDKDGEDDEDDPTPARKKNSKPKDKHHDERKQRTIHTNYDNEEDTTDGNTRNTTRAVLVARESTKPTTIQSLSSFGLHIWHLFQQPRKIVSSSVSYMISSLHQRILSDPERWGRIAISTVQLGLLLYFARTIWSVMNEIVDDFYQQQQNHFSSSHAEEDDPLYTNPDDITKLIHYFDHIATMKQEHPIIRNQDEKDDDVLSNLMGSSDIPIPPTHLLHLGYKLLASGIPLRSFLLDEEQQQLQSNKVASSMTPPNHFLGCSIQSLLSELTRSEMNLLQQCLWLPKSFSLSHEDTTTTNNKNAMLWNHISGLQEVKDGLLGTVAMLTASRSRNDRTMENAKSVPHLTTHAFRTLFQNDDPRSSSHHPSSSTANHGILLYGPPGCGKTLLVKALTQMVQLPCLVVTPSLLFRKYVGATNLQIRTLFQLATKLSPCIVCIDELDGLFRERNDNEHEVNRELKTEFLQWWDGMLSSSSSGATIRTACSTSRSHHRGPILVIGATNRPFDVDTAVLRRFSQSYYVGLPNVQDRYHLLTQLLHNIPKEESSMNLQDIAHRTETYTPNDIRQVLQTAALMGPLRRRTTSSTTRESSHGNNTDDDTLSPLLSMSDILQALRTVHPTPWTNQYHTQLSDFVRRRQSTPNNNELLFSSSSSPFDVAESQPLHSSVSQEQEQQQQQQRLVRRWETDYGNFYHIGTLELDQHTFETLADMAKQMKEEDSNNNNTSEDD